MHASHDQRARGAVTQQLADEKLSDLARMRSIRETTLGGKGVTLEPFEQPFAVRADDVGLHEVHMRIDESGHDELARAVGERDLRVELRQQFWCAADLANMAVLHDQQAVCMELV